MWDTDKTSKSGTVLDVLEQLAPTMRLKYLHNNNEKFLLLMREVNTCEEKFLIVGNIL